MRRGLELLFLFLPTCWCVAGSPAEAAAAAAKDARTLPAEVRHAYRYLSLYAVPEKERNDFKKALAFHFHCLSREPEIVPLVMVTPDLCRVYFDDYGWDRNVWEKLAPFEVYFHLVDGRQIRKVEVKVKPVAVVPALEERDELVYVFRNGFVQVRRSSVDASEEFYEKIGDRQFRHAGTGPGPGGKGKQKKETAQDEGKGGQDLKPELDTSKQVIHAPWADPVALVELAKLLNSDVPIVRADWFVFWTGSPFRRGGSGYYDFLGLKSLKDAEKLAGLDIDAARKLRLEMAALVDDSGVALNNRQILWFRTLAGSWWQTLDSSESVGRKNALRLYDGDFEAEAFEIYFSLPSGVWGLLAANAKDGTLQDVVPQAIALNHVSPSNDKNIYTGFSCVECHTEGIRPITDWARETFNGPVALASRDPKKLKRLQRLYLSDLPEQVAEDNRRYAKVVLKINGLTPEKNASNYIRAYRRYSDARLSFEEICAELACEPAAFRKALEAYAAPGDADPVLTGLLARKPRPLRREHAEELFGVMNNVLRGLKP